MRKIAKYLLPAFILIALLGLTACEWVLSGAKKEAVLAFSETSVDNLLAGWTAGDYAVFSRDFDTDLLEEIPADKFAELKQDFDSQLGYYISRRVDQVTRSDEFYVVTYQARFQREESLTITVVFHASDRTIAYLAFDSETVSWSTFQ